MGIELNEQDVAKSYKQSLIDFGEILVHRVSRPWLLVNSIYKFSETYKTERGMLDVMHGFSDKVIAERKKTFDANQNSYSARKKKAMLDLLLSAQQNGEEIDDLGIREEVDTFLFGVSEMRWKNVKEDPKREV